MKVKIEVPFLMWCRDYHDINEFSYNLDSTIFKGKNLQSDEIDVEDYGFCIAFDDAEVDDSIMLKGIPNWACYVGLFWTDDRPSDEEVKELLKKYL